MIASVTFRNFKALRNTSLALAPFNLIVGPNGSGKTSLIQALLLLRGLAKLPIKDSHGTVPPVASLEIGFGFSPPFADLAVTMACSSDFACDLLKVRSPSPELWSRAKGEILRIRSFLFDHTAIAEPSPPDTGGELAGNAGNLAAVLRHRHDRQPMDFGRIEAEFCRLLPEFSGLETMVMSNGFVSFAARLGGGGERVPAQNLSQGALYTLAALALVFDPAPPSVVCIEEMDRGIHPRMLREIRDLFYRLSYPEAFGEKRPPSQVLASTHSPYLLDLFRDHPEEVVIAQKEGSEARFERLTDRPDVADILREGPLGDLWFSGILGGVPAEKRPE